MLQCLTDYAQLFLSRLEKTESVLDKDGREFMSHTNGKVKPEITKLEKRTRLDEENLSAPRVLRPHAFNPSIDFKKVETEQITLSGEKEENLKKILHIEKNTVRPEELIRVFDKDVVRSGSCDIELSVLRWVSDIIGYPEQARGCTVSGTSMGVIVAFSTARHVKLADSSQFRRSVVYMTDLAHFSHTRALRVVGLADVIVRHVPTVKYRMDSRKLEKLIMEDREAGLYPFMVVGTVGTTGLGTIDPLGDISEVAQKHGLWFHVDAAIGGCLMLDEAVKKRCEGINMSDSVALDFHKSLSTPYGSAAVLVRDGKLLKWAMARDSAPFIADSTDEDGYSPTDFGFELTRPFRAFPVWFMLKSLGTEMIKTALREKVRLTKYAFKSIRDMADVVTCTEPDLTVIAFRYFQPGSEDGNDVTRKWHELIAKEGQVCMTPTTADGLFYIRLCILSFRSHIEDVDIALSAIRRNLDVILREKDIFITRL
ncbi:tryptophan decarboxylase-like [Liolophura sinensis]|uniref:tryptophan decarboxylase-like n=1 Tax=Liolophura sinensis TaxID=3198878 RepID=UPI003159740E